MNCYRYILSGRAFVVTGLLTALLFTLTDCTTYKRCLKKFPPQPEIDTIFSDTTIYRDTILYDTIKGDTVYSEILTEIPVEITTEMVSAETELAYASAYVFQSRLILTLIQKDSLLKFKLDSAITANKKTVIITEKIPYEVQLPPKPFYRIAFFITGILLLLVIILLIILK